MTPKDQFIGYEYKDKKVQKRVSSMIIDGYENFGWKLDSSHTPAHPVDSVEMKFKRNRKIRNKAELTRLQRQFDAIVEEIQKLENKKQSLAMIVAFSIGVLGTAFIAGSVFAVEAGNHFLMVLLAIPGFIGWILPYFTFKKVEADKTKQITPLIDQKYDELYEITEQGNRLLTD
ncbi:hypothetical protein ACFFIF_09200 [Vagococcus entomophilus]|uniref:Uncharacterized protein n=1 Tax=Vagococcus entomophilus TaxID=1160095 RepID=A0A430AGP1_9ENTE|nr:hypothetical protein [Vagococcus entomophilus]RSU07070.1 hypothetical protein CBF30_07375 [Vagococcus entomophilus]